MQDIQQAWLANNAASPVPQGGGSATGLEHIRKIWREARTASVAARGDGTLMEQELEYSTGRARLANNVASPVLRGDGTQMELGEDIQRA